jgi:hypothetical protein
MNLTRSPQRLKPGVRRATHLPIARREKVGQELVRGWRASGNRVDELAQAAEAGALAQQYSAPVPQ